MSEYQIKCENLVLGYEGEPITKDINFTVCFSDYVCIVGENGSGKSTLLKTLLGLNKPLSGKIMFADGFNNRHKGYLPQQTVVQSDFPATFYEIVLSGFQGQIGIRPFYTKAEKDIPFNNIKEMNLFKFINKSFKELFGGQKQRDLLARALCATRKLLFLDEPVAGLDQNVTEEMYTIINELNKKGVTIIMISHDIDKSLKYATHILHIGQEIIFQKKMII